MYTPVFFYTIFFSPKRLIYTTAYNLLTHDAVAKPEEKHQ